MYKIFKNSSNNSKYYFLMYTINKLKESHNNFSCLTDLILKLKQIYSFLIKVTHLPIFSRRYLFPYWSSSSRFIHLMQIKTPADNWRTDWLTYKQTVRVQWKFFFIKVQEIFSEFFLTWCSTWEWARVT